MTSGRKPMTTASLGRCSGAGTAFVVWQDEPLTDEVKDRYGRKLAWGTSPWSGTPVQKPSLTGSWKTTNPLTAFAPSAVDPAAGGQGRRGRFH